MMELEGQRPCRRLAVCAFAAVLHGAFFVSGPVAADDAAAVPEILTLTEAAELLRVDPLVLKDMARRREVPGRRIEVQWRFSRSALLAWLAGADVGTAKLYGTELEKSGTAGQASPGPPSGARQGEPLSPEAMSRVTAAGTTPAQEETTPPSEQKAPPSEQKAPEQPIGEAPKERTAEEVFLRGQRVLLAPGEVVLDVGMFYSETNDRQLALVNGGVGLATVKTDTFTGTLLGRYGLFEETELFASSTYQDQNSDVHVGSQRVTGPHHSEFGDVRLGARRTVLREGVGRPDVILTVDGHIPTDDNHSSYAVGGGIALVKSMRVLLRIVLSRSGLACVYRLKR